MNRCLFKASFGLKFSMTPHNSCSETRLLAIEGYFNWVKQMSGKLSESLAIINIQKMHLKKCKGRHLTFYWIAIESEGPVEAGSGSGSASIGAHVKG